MVAGSIALVRFGLAARARQVQGGLPILVDLNGALGAGQARIAHMWSCSGAIMHGAQSFLWWTKRVRA
jgi:hypothetical protein